MHSRLAPINSAHARMPRPWYGSLVRCTHRLIEQYGRCFASLSGPSTSSRPFITLERSVGDHFGADAELRETRAFAAEVFPDLPVATTWNNLFRAMTKHRDKSKPGATDMDDQRVTPGAQKVITIAANLRSMKDIEARIIHAAAPEPHSQVPDEGPAACQPADALLLVSGSHPARSLPGARWLLPTSLNTLELAGRLRNQGSIPACTQLWAVANPNTEPNAALLEQKVAKGAEVILTQPPFDQAAYEHWIADVDKRGLLAHAKIIVGMPMVTSPGNVAFWMTLSNCLRRSACQALLAKFWQAQGTSKQALEQYFEQYNRELVQQMISSPAVAGLHVMPITARGKKMTLQFIHEGIIPSWAQS